MVAGPKIDTILQEKVEVSDGMGNTTVEWKDLVSFKAVLVPLTTKEMIFFDKDTVFATYRLLCDYKAVNLKNIDKVKEKNRIRIGEQFFGIKGVRNFYNRHWELDLLEVK